MILSIISEYISIDKIITKNSKKYVHFITHLDDLLIVPDDWESIIYTSKSFAKILSTKKVPIKSKYFRIMEANQEIKLTLRDGITFKVTMFMNSGATGNVMFYFDDSKQKTLFTGPFTQYRNFLLNRNFQMYVISGIHNLYIDNTRANSVNYTTMESVGIQIAEILSKHPGYQVWLHLPVFGYEDLIISLIKDSHFKVYVGSEQLRIFQYFENDKLFTVNPKDADIVIGKELLTIEKLRYRFLKKNRITIEMIEANFELKKESFNIIGLYYIHWSPHPSLFQLYSFIEFIKPTNLYEIYEDFSKLPKFLKDLQLKDSKLEIMENLNDILNDNILDDNILDNNVADSVSLAETEIFDINATKYITFNGNHSRQQIESPPLKLTYTNMNRNEIQLPRRIKKLKKPVVVAIVTPNKPKIDDFQNFLAESSFTVSNTSSYKSDIASILSISDPNCSLLSGFHDQNGQQLSGFHDQNSQQLSGFHDQNSQQLSGFDDQNSQHLSGFDDQNNKGLDISKSSKRKSIDNISKDTLAKILNYSLPSSISSDRTISNIQMEDENPYHQPDIPEENTQNENVQSISTHIIPSKLSRYRRRKSKLVFMSSDEEDSNCTYFTKKNTNYIN